jgi:hypothetical protein
LQQSDSSNPSEVAALPQICGYQDATRQCQAHLISSDDPQLQAAVAATGLNISLVNQPPNSQDMNVLNLGYFNAIQSLQHRKHTNTNSRACEGSGRQLQRTPQTTNIL